MIFKNHIFSLFSMREIIFLTLFIWFEKIFFLSKYSIGKNLRNNLFNFITVNEGNFFFKLKNIFLWITLSMYYATAQTFISLIQRKKIIKKLHWIKETFPRLYSNAQIFVEPNKHFFGCIGNIKVHAIQYFCILFVKHGTGTLDLRQLC